MHHLDPFADVRFFLPTLTAAEQLFVGFSPVNDSKKMDSMANNHGRTRLSSVLQLQPFLGSGFSSGERPTKKEDHIKLINCVVGGTVGREVERSRTNWKVYYTGCRTSLKAAEKFLAFYFASKTATRSISPDSCLEKLTARCHGLGFNAGWEAEIGFQAGQIGAHQRWNRFKRGIPTRTE